MIARKTQIAARSAFSLMEMLVVVAIIVALAGIGGYYYFAQLDKARESTAYSQIKTIEKACETYQINNGVFPDSLDLLVQPDEANDDKPYLESQDNLIDPWNNQYQYEVTQVGSITKPRIYATSPDGEVIDNLTRQK